MCDFPSWIMDADNKPHFLVDKDIERIIEDKGGVWEDFIGHSAIEKYLGVTGEHQEGGQDVPFEFLAAIRAGECVRMAKAGGYDGVLTHGKHEVHEVHEGHWLVLGRASVAAYGSSSVAAYGSSSVAAYGSASVNAYGSASVNAYDSASVNAYDSASVNACGSASVNAYGSASVNAYGSVSVNAYGSASVEAYDSARVKACGSASVVDHRAKK